ncbi:unnamed protein product [Vitrella brassicaformis CCMP3155]|uniref:Maspardin n=1 Tax=Vitrella brassicaformis (strain CCMP3155) TaxID=1169540 RepID=A0A0G4ELZ1_VITBC|nr:unnamed protein product [Vitrella brassicaformis CCMP3155]|eukprot:CEL97992.1 unnamed protein product [Vitrella brassicaformis CCMP3155]
MKISLPRCSQQSVWSYFELPGDRSDSRAREEPLVFVHGTSGTASCFFLQMEELAKKGYRVISCQYAACKDVRDWVKSFDRFLDALSITKAHLFGAQLGGFLVQSYAASHPGRVCSLILCNAFSSTAHFADATPWLSLIAYLPGMVVRRLALEAFPRWDKIGTDMCQKEAAAFMHHQLSSVPTKDLVSRLTLNCTANSVPSVLPTDQKRITLLHVADKTHIPEALTQDVKKRYPRARVAELKSGGDFPYLSRPDDVTLHIVVHLRAAGVFPQAHLTTRHDKVTHNGVGAGAVGGSVSSRCGCLSDEERAARKRKQMEWKNPFAD